MPSAWPLRVSHPFWDRINWITEGLSNDGKAFFNPLGVEETRAKREIWGTIKTGCCNSTSEMRLFVVFPAKVVYRYRHVDDHIRET